MKDAEVERLTDSLQITKFILDKCNEQGRGFHRERKLRQQ